MTDREKEYNAKCRELDPTLPDNWYIYAFSLDPNEVPTGYFKVTGACFNNYKRGKDKGQIRWFLTKENKDTVKTFFIKLDKNV